ncbi:MAG TPA: hypothetical protein VFV52_08155 [Bacilli bacterium]|nr:hypothetical protein [Bacilli bacterium]
MPQYDDFRTEDEREFARRDQDGIKSALQAEFEAETQGAFTLRDTNNLTEVGDHDEHRNLGGTDEITRSGAVLPLTGTADSTGGDAAMRLNTGNKDDDGDGVPLAAKDGIRYDYDDASDV